MGGALGGRGRLALEDEQVVRGPLDDLIDRVGVPDFVVRLDPVDEQSELRREVSNNKGSEYSPPQGSAIIARTNKRARSDLGTFTTSEMIPIIVVKWAVCSSHLKGESSFSSESKVEPQ